MPKYSNEREKWREQKRAQRARIKENGPTQPQEEDSGDFWTS